MNSSIKKILAAAVATVALAGIYVAGIHFGLYGNLERDGAVSEIARPAHVVARGVELQKQAMAALGAPQSKQILFGDLHVHTTFSVDAFVFNLPTLQGEGAHPPADACDFARYCSALDFYSINDHAESLTPRKWGEIKQSVRQCNDVAGDPGNPDLAAFTGWEWTNSSPKPATHYGHKNVIFKNTAEGNLPARPILAPGGFKTASRKGYFSTKDRIKIPLEDFANRQRYYDLEKTVNEIAAIPFCPAGVDVRELPLECAEVAETPKILFEKLDQWGFPSIVIPHGNAWGGTGPALVEWDNQLANGNHDPKFQRLIEVFSGHGNSEEYRTWREIALDEDGNPYCPAPSGNFTPMCHQAGEIIRSRCLAVGESVEECDSRAADSRRIYIEAGRMGAATVTGTVSEDWGDAGECNDCFMPAFSFRPGGSAQAALGSTQPANEEGAQRLRFGFIGSSDTHSARAGSGYKEFLRNGMVDVMAPRDPKVAKSMAGPAQEPVPYSVPVTGAFTGPPAATMERAMSYLITGGQAAVHANGRDRGAIWDALERKETYATSGPRILLWFDLLNGPDGAELPMGSETEMSSVPKFRVRAAGSFKQKTGCPDYALNGLTPERLALLCHDECYNPSDERYLITRIEVIRIKPQIAAGEDKGPLIETPWRTFDCAPDAEGCTVEFDDPEYAALGRDTVYYARAIQEPTEAVNANPLGCEYDADGVCIKVNMCHPQSEADDCLREAEERAWSSPIFVDYEKS